MLIYHLAIAGLLFSAGFSFATKILELHQRTISNLKSIDELTRLHQCIRRAAFVKNVKASRELLEMREPNFHHLWLRGEKTLLHEISEDDDHCCSIPLDTCANPKLEHGSPINWKWRWSLGGSS